MSEVSGVLQTRHHIREAILRFPFNLLKKSIHFLLQCIQLNVHLANLDAVNTLIL